MNCACRGLDRWDCWAVRYGILRFDVEADGGPCECSCHDEDDEDDDFECVPISSGKQTDV